MDFSDAITKAKEIQTEYKDFMEQLEHAVKQSITLNLASLPISISGLHDLISAGGGRAWCACARGVRDGGVV